MKSLKEIGFDQYYQAEQTGWVLYLEGSTDLAILRAFAAILQHPAESALDRPFTHYVLNQPSKAREHFHGLREASRNLKGLRYSTEWTTISGPARSSLNICGKDERSRTTCAIGNHS